MVTSPSSEKSPTGSPSAGLTGQRRVQAFAFGGLLMVLLNFPQVTRSTRMSSVNSKEAPHFGQFISMPGRL